MRLTITVDDQILMDADACEWTRTPPNLTALGLGDDARAEQLKGAPWYVPLMVTMTPLVAQGFANPNGTHARIIITTQNRCWTMKVEQ